MNNRYVITTKKKPNKQKKNKNKIKKKRKLLNVFLIKIKKTMLNNKVKY